MTDRCPLFSRPSRVAACLLCASALWGATAQAQSLQPSAPLDTPPSVALASASRTADFIVALVNSDPVTNNEVRQRLLHVEQQLTSQGAVLPQRDELARQVLEQLVRERVQLQHAAELGLRVDEAELAQAERLIAAQNQLSVEEFRRRVAADGTDINRLRNELRNQLLLQRLQEREVLARVQVTQTDLDEFMQQQQSSPQASALELHLGHVLVMVTEDADAARIQERQARAQDVADRARRGEDFAALARAFSDAPERVNDGQLGMRSVDRLPALFVESTRALPVGAIAGPLRSAAGFHVLKVLDKHQAGQPGMVVTQTRARHILLRTSPQLSQAEALTRLDQLRQRLTHGQADFQALAREYSQDGSARAGGDLGWTRPGQFVPEFEQAMNALRVGEVSQPLVSRFGVHLIQVDERRDVELSPHEQREIVRELVREKKTEAALQAWLQDVRARAFVEFREAPQP